MGTAGTHRFSSGGVVYAYRSWAFAPASAGPLILLHGFAQSAASWDAVAPALAEAAKRPVYALDLVGHGRSERPDDPRAYRLGAQADALLAFARVLSVDAGRPPAVLGYSMGGRVALAAAARDPRAFAVGASALVLDAAGLGPAPRAEREAAAERDAANAARVRAEGVPAFMDAWERLPLFATQCDLPPDVRAHVRAGRVANDVEALARTFEYAGQHVMPDRDDVSAAFKALHAHDVPVLYVAGGRDAKYCALAASAAKEGATACIVPGAGHNVHLEAPAVFAREVAAFLSAH